jgi:hypothetical protein
MAFAQLTRRKSLRGMETCLQTLDAELCHTIANPRLAACWPVPAQSATGASLPTSLKPSFSRRPLARTVCRRIPANRPCAGLSDQQLHRAGAGHCATLPPRWHIELFFKWNKQHRRIKACYGTSENAVRTQIWMVILVYLLVAPLKKRLHLDWSHYTML